MQRYRVNYGLLIGLCVGLFVIGVGGYFGLKYQLDRNADQLIVRADEAEEAGELREATEFLLRYYRQRPDDAKIGERVCYMFCDILSLPDAVPAKDYGNAVTMMEAVLRKHGESLPQLRKRLAEMYVYGRRWVDARKHIEMLLNVTPQDADLQRDLSTCLLREQETERATEYMSKLVGLDRGAGEFNAEAATGPQVVEVYPMLAGLILQEDDEDMARAVIDRMVSANPESAIARVARAQFLLARRNEEDADQADTELKEALKLDPEDARVLLVNAARKRDKEAYNEARELLGVAREKHPDNIDVYREFARLELSESNDDSLDKALAHLDDGVKEVEPGPRRTLLYFKSSLQANSGDAEGLAESIDELEKTGGLDPVQIDYLRARLLVLERQWFEASKLFEKIRPVVTSVREMSGTTNYLLGVCYQQLGQLDLARDALQIAKEYQPGNKRIDAMLRQIDGSGSGGSTQAGGLMALMAEQLAKPEEEQDWSLVDSQLEEVIEKQELDEARAGALRADILIRRGRYAEAREIAETLLEQNPEDELLTRIVVRIAAGDPDRGAVEALRLFEEAEPKFAESAAMRLLKADLLIAINDEALSGQLLALADGTEGWPEAKQVTLLRGLAGKFAQTRDADARRAVLERVVELAPGELSTLLDLFRADLAVGDDAQVRGTQAKILAVVGDEGDATWLFTEATRLVTKAVQAGGDKKTLAKANDLVDRALGSRPGWNLLYLTRADIAFARGDRAASLAALDRADQLGRSPVPAVVRHVGLLAEAGRFADARRILEKAAPAVRERVLGRQYAEALLNTGSVREAIDAATGVGEASAEQAGVQLWLGRFMRRVAAAGAASDDEKLEAEQKSLDALESTVALAPSAAEGWLELTMHHAIKADRLAAEAVMRRAQIALPADQAIVVLARGYEFVGRHFDAENLYKTLLTRQPDSLGVRRDMAAFYLSGRYPRDDGRLKASRLINEILAAAADRSDDGPATGAQVGREASILWARRAAARELSRTNDYQSLLKAEKLLSSNAVDGRLGQDDLLLMAQILGPRPEPESRMKAIRLFESLKKNRRLDTRSGTALGQLYFVTRNWDACRNQMSTVIAQAPDDPAPRAAYIRMLLQQGDRSSLDNAARQLKALRRLAPTAVETQELIARVFTAFDREQEARKALAGLLQRKEATTQTYVSVARLLTELGDNELAEKIYLQLADRDARVKLRYAGFVGQTGDIEKAFSILEGLRDEFDAVSISRIALVIARERHDELGDAVDEPARTWIERGLREDPESIDLLLMRAELHDLRQEYDGALAIYRRLLAGGELTGSLRAVVLNNLAYLLALSPGEQGTPDDAMGFVGEAVEILGPTADILDTRAVVRIAQGKPKQAIADLELSLTDNPTASKLFHLCHAHYRAGQLNEAVDAWDRAVELGLTREETSAIERAVFDEIEKQVRKVRGGE